MSDENGNHGPSPTAPNGRGLNGQFGAGNQYGRGNPHARRVQQIRAALLEVCTPERMRNAAEKLMVQAENGDRFAFAELADRVLGKPIPADLAELVEQVEALVAEKNNNR
jgi:hypothetical protein